MNGLFALSFVFKSGYTRGPSSTLRNSHLIDLGWLQGIKIVKAPQMTLKYIYLVSKVIISSSSLIVFLSSRPVALGTTEISQLLYQREANRLSDATYWFQYISKSAKPEGSGRSFHKELLPTHWTYPGVWFPLGGLSSEENSVVMR